MGSSSALAVLVACAQAIVDRNLKLADSLLQVIWNADGESNESKKKWMKYFAEALVRRVYGLYPVSIYNSFLFRPSLKLSNSFLWHHLNETVKDAINNAVMGKKRLHLIDFYIPHIYGGQRYLFNHLPRISGNPLSVRVSIVLPLFMKNTVNVQQEEQYLTEEAKEFEVELEEEFLKVVYANSLGEVDDASMSYFRRTQEDEAVMVFYSNKLQTLLAEAGAMEREWVKLRQINPEIVIIEEQDANLNNDSNFIKRLEDCFQYYSLAFPFDIPYFYELDNYYRLQIGNIVGCEGRDRIMRPQTLAQWNFRLLGAGFIQVPLQSNLVSQNEVYHKMFEEKGCLVLNTNNHPLYFVSAWKVGEWEGHFNLNSNNFDLDRPVSEA